MTFVDWLFLAGALVWLMVIYGATALAAAITARRENQDAKALPRTETGPAILATDTASWRDEEQDVAPEGLGLTSRLRDMAGDNADLRDALDGLDKTRDAIRRIAARQATEPVAWVPGDTPSEIIENLRRMA